VFLGGNGVVKGGGGLILLGELYSELLHNEESDKGFTASTS
jgi:hypothetical protein